MAEVRVTQRLANPAEIVWALVGDFGGLHRWHPRVEGLDLSWEGRIRTVRYVDGSRAVERLEARNDALRRYVYVVVDGNIPMQRCRAVLQVEGEGKRSMVIWSCEFEPQDDEASIVAALRTLYGDGLSALASAFDGKR